MNARRGLYVAMVVGLLVSGCGASQGELLVSAAASLGEAFEAIEDEFERLHPDIDVVLNLAGSTTLANQIVEGAPVDVFASADEMSVANLDPEILHSEPAVFATNRIQIAMPAGNPGEVVGLDSLENNDLLVGSCDVSVPCGLLAAQIVEDAELQVEFDTFEPNVKALLTKVENGELDAGLVYVTDTFPGVEIVEIESDRTTSYPIAAVSADQDGTLFVDFVLSPAGQEILAEFGFGTP